MLPMCECPPVYTSYMEVDMELTGLRGHFNQRETPEAREAQREEMEDKEVARAKKAKKELKAYKDQRKK